MAGEQILVIEDNPINLRLTQILLTNEGYTIRTAPDAEEALAILDHFEPALILVDIQLPGMDGLELTRRVKMNPSTRDIVVVALTAFAMNGDEQRAMEQGCDGYITKPIDTRSLPVRLREYLSKHATQAENGASRRVAPADPDVEGLRCRFLVEGLERSQALLDCLPSILDPLSAGRVAHQWIGAAGLFGYTRISGLAREIEGLLRERPLDSAQLRESLTALVYAFADQPGARQIDVPAAIGETLSGRRIALVGFTGAEADRLSAALGRAHAHTMLLTAAEDPGSPAVQASDLIMLHVRPETLSTPWLCAASRAGARPLVFVGDLENLLVLDSLVQQSAGGFLVDPWHLEEAWMRAFLALAHSTPLAPASAAAAPYRPQVLLAALDPIVPGSLRGALINQGMEVVTVSSRADAMERIRSGPLDAAILDVQTPGMDGLELLAGIRARHLPIKVVLLTSRGQEDDVVRGAVLGADDYMVKPFNPATLVARLEWVLHR